MIKTNQKGKRSTFDYIEIEEHEYLEIDSSDSVKSK